MGGGEKIDLANPTSPSRAPMATNFIMLDSQNELYI